MDEKSSHFEAVVNRKMHMKTTHEQQRLLLLQKDLANQLSIEMESNFSLILESNSHIRTHHPRRIPNDLCQMIDSLITQSSFIGAHHCRITGTRVQRHTGTITRDVFLV